MSTSYEEQLREQLHATTPALYAGLDPAAVIGAGERVVRRGRIRTALVAAVAVAVVAVGTQLLTNGRPVAAPVPAQTGPRITGSVTLVSPGPANLGGVDHTYVVSVRPGDGKDLMVDYAEKTADGLVSMGGAGIDPADRRITWAHGGTSSVVLGVIPSATAQHRIIVTASDDFGGYASDVAAIPGTDYSAFVAYYEKPLSGDNPVESILWFDSRGRPVDGQGHVGSIATVGGEQVWLTADGTALGSDQGSYVAGPEDIYVNGFTAGPQADAPWTVLAVIRPEVTTAAAVTAFLSDGSSHVVPTVPLGKSRALAVTVPGKYDSTGALAPSQVTLTEIRWTDSAGTAHVKPVLR
jgi:hypothetical protein